MEKKTSMQDSQGGDDANGSGDDEKDSFLDNESGLSQNDDKNDSDSAINEKGMLGKDTIQLQKKIIVVQKHNLSTVQESEDMMPFAKKMDSALNFIDEAFSENVQ